jgi:tetratricopeptide (TPR) repeat protein
VALWKSVINGNPHKRRPRMNYADALVERGRQSGDSSCYGEALRELQTLMSLPDDGSSNIRNLYGEVGLIYYKLGMSEEAIGVWKEGLNKAPFDAALENNIAIALLHQGKLDEALDHALRAREANPFMPKPLFTLGEIYMAKGEYLKAAEHFLRYEDLQPENLNSIWNTAQAFLQAGRVRQAYEQAERYLVREKDPRLRAEGQVLLNEIEMMMQNSTQGMAESVRH